VQHSQNSLGNSKAGYTALISLNRENGGGSNSQTRAGAANNILKN